MRIALLRDEQSLGATLRVVMRRIFAWQRKRARTLGVSDPHCGGMALPQRFGGRLNANPHFHIIATDGVFFEAENGDLRFFRLPPPTRELKKRKKRGHARSSRSHTNPLDPRDPG